MSPETLAQVVEVHSNVILLLQETLTAPANKTQVELLVNQTIVDELKGKPERTEKITFAQDFLLPLLNKDYDYHSPPEIISGLKQAFLPLL